jgi:hypothetical protein
VTKIKTLICDVRRNELRKAVLFTVPSTNTVTDRHVESDRVHALAVPRYSRFPN